MNLIERDRVSVWHPFALHGDEGALIPISRGEREFLFGCKGERYIDAISSWWCVLHGHANPFIAAKLKAQLDQLHHVIFSDFTHAPGVELAERLLQCLPGGLSRIFYSDNGSTACEVALKIALQYWFNRGEARSRFIAFEGAYHGDTFGSMSVGARGSFVTPFGALLFEVDRIPVPVVGREEESIAALRALLAHGRHAAFIFEPLVLGAAGMLMYRAEVLDELLGLCSQHGVLAIADEVMTGFGRTGPLFASSYLKNHPDLVCLSKGLTGGTLPLGATAVSREVYGEFHSESANKPFLHGHTYTGNLLSCTAALASLDLLESAECKKNRERISAEHADFRVRIEDHSRVSSPRVQGTILAFDVDASEGRSYAHPVRDSLYNFFLSRRVLLRPLGNTVYVLPPYCISSESLAEVYAAIHSALEKS